MPKRNCPFTDSNRPQLKNHISVKEVNLGVMSHEKMKSVYERTLGMMYAASRTGGKDSLQVCNNNIAELERVAVTPPNGYAAPLPGQRKLNFSGQLDGVYTPDQCATVPAQSQHQMFVPIACSTCRYVPSTPRICQYCERCLCEYCCRECKSCYQTFCTDCSTVRYDTADEVWMCYNCV